MNETDRNAKQDAISITWPAIAARLSINTVDDFALWYVSRKHHFILVHGEMQRRLTFYSNSLLNAKCFIDAGGGLAVPVLVEEYLSDENKCGHIWEATETQGHKCRNCHCLYNSGYRWANTCAGRR